MIQSGTVYFDSGWNGWTLNNGNGPRTFVSPDISFQPPFGTPPIVVLALMGIDSHATTNVRVRVELAEAENDEFNIAVHTWDDTIVHGVGVSWIAYDR